MLRHVETGITLEFPSAAAASFRFAASDAADSKLITHTEPEQLADAASADPRFLSKKARGQLQRSKGLLPIVSEELIFVSAHHALLPRVPDPRLRASVLALQRIPFWGSRGSGQAIKVQHAAAGAADHAVYLSPAGFIYIGPDGAMIVDDRGELSATRAEAHAVVEMWGAQSLLGAFCGPKVRGS